MECSTSWVAFYKGSATSTKMAVSKKKPVTRETLLRHLSVCLNLAIRSCAKDPTLVFPGCPEITQLAWRVADRLGFGLEAVVIQGKGREAETNRWVDHVWVELPEAGIRIETNASQILGLPQFVAVLDINEFSERYKDSYENMEVLDRVTREGEEFYGQLAEDIARCVTAKANKKKDHS